MFNFPEPYFCMDNSATYVMTLVALDAVIDGQANYVVAGISSYDCDGNRATAYDSEWDCSTSWVVRNLVFGVPC
jgi:hypothetical protein